MTSMVQPTIEGDVPEPADDYQDWVDKVRPTFVEVARTGHTFLSWQVKVRHKLPDPPNPSVHWGLFLARLHSEGLIQHAGWDTTRDGSGIRKWRGTPAAVEGRIS